MNTLEATIEPSGAPSIAVMNPPDPLAVLREQLAAVEAERDTLKASEAALQREITEYQSALKDREEKLKALEENPLTFALANLDAGQVLIDAGESLKDLCAVVLRRQEKGKLALNITVKPFKGEALVFVPEVKVTEPKPEPQQSVFYSTEDGALSRNDPRQREFRFPGRDRDDR